MSEPRQPTDPTASAGYDRVWLYWPIAGLAPTVFRTKSPNIPAVEYMRVLSRQEVEKLANDREGVDVQQYINSLLRTIEGQRTHIARLEKTCQDYADAMEEDGNV